MDGNSLMLLATPFLAMFLFLSAIDGIWLHLWRYRLPERPESRFEHRTHALRALLFVPVLALLFLDDFAGAALGAAAALVAIDLAVEAVDGVSEKNSRASMGGLPHEEYLLHLTLTTVRVAAIALAFASRPAEAWSVDAPLVLGHGLPAATVALARLALPGAIAAALLHVALVLRPRLASEAESALRRCAAKAA